MRILWFCNGPTAEARELFKLPPNPFGGWLDGLSLPLAEKEGILLFVAFCGKSGDSPLFKKGKKITYIMYDPGKDMKHNIELIISEVAPDVIHIHGVEFEQHNCLADCLDLSRTVASIQGLKSYCADKFLSGIDERFWRRVPLTYIGLRRGSLIKQKRKFEKSARSETELLNKLQFVIGRTTWDLACTQMTNSNLRYYKNNEILRNVFYECNWNPETICRHSIFLSQAGYPIKGAHFLLRAMASLKKKYPDIHLFVAGGKTVGGKGLRDKMKMSAYGLYLKTMIRRLDLNENVTFTGVLSAEEMKERLLQSHVFVLPSTIENSPNSLGEAMLLGMPCIAACVGGVQDMLRDKEEGFIYPGNDVALLAYYIDKIFSDDRVAIALGKRAQEHARKTHNRDENVAQLLDIYREIQTDEG